MLAIVGILMVIGLVFGGYTLAGGKFGIIVKALPFEFLMIGGAAAGTFLIANGIGVVKGALADLKRVFKGAYWTRDDYRDLLSLMYIIVKLLKTRGVLALEPHVDDPGESSLFAKYPKIQHDHFALDFITDTLRMMTMSMDDPYQVEDCMQRQLKKHHAELHTRSGALQNVADALPAIGIVAAVLGIIKTMASIDQPVEVLGGMIGGALVGTFLGVYLAYGFVGPMTAKLNQTYAQDGQFYAIIRDCLVAYLQGHSAPIAVEVARGNAPSPL
jgi:chemotaxis protein MotA